MCGEGLFSNTHPSPSHELLAPLQLKLSSTFSSLIPGRKTPCVATMYLPILNLRQVMLRCHSTLMLGQASPSHHRCWKWEPRKESEVKQIPSRRHQPTGTDPQERTCHISVRMSHGALRSFVLNEHSDRSKHVQKQTNKQEGAENQVFEREYHQKGRRE